MNSPGKTNCGFLKLLLWPIIGLSLTSYHGNAQSMGISSSAITPDASSILELRTTSKGMLIPRMTTTERNAIGSPATGLMIYNSTTNNFNFYNGSSWTAIFSGSAGVNSIGGTTNRISIGGTSADPTVDISSGYVGQSSITTLGTIGTGTWNGSTIGVAYGGTGQTSQQAAINALTGTQTSGTYLRSNGTNAILSTIQAADVPTLNQNTTGSAATLTTSRNIYGGSFNGSADVTSIIASTYGGTGNGFTKFTGPATAEKTFTLPDASATILTSNAAVTVAQGGTGQTSYTNGQLLIGNTTGNTLTKSTLTAGTGISVTNGGGSITITNTSPSSGGTVTSVAALTLGTTGTDLSSSVATGTTTPVITLNVPTASAANRGALSSADWSTFNGKESVLTFSTGLTRSTNTVTVNTSQNINTLSNLTSNGLIKTSGGTGALSIATSGTDYSAGTSALATGILKSTTTTGALSIAVAGDFPTLNQNTTGSAATLTTSRNIYGGSFNGSADVTSIIASTYGGTGNGFTKFTGPATAEKTFTLPNASATILTSNAAVTVAQGGTGAGTLASNGVLYGNGTGAIQALPVNSSATVQYLSQVSSGTPAWVTPTNGTVTSVSGTTNRITVATGTTTPVIDISASYVGQSSITTLGTIGTGTWNGTLIGNAYGGTGTSTSFTPGSVVFAGASGVYNQNNGKIFWDNTNFRLGIGTASPNTAMQIGAIGTGTENVLIGGTASPGYMLNTQGAGDFGTIYSDATNTVGIGFSPTIAVPSRSVFKVNKTGAATFGTSVSTDDNIILQPFTGGSNSFAGTITSADLTVARTYTLPNASGTLPVSASGNIALSSSGDISFTGILPVGNGGTGTSTAFTPGSVVFAGASGAFNQNNSKLFWDNTNYNLGIGTSTFDGTNPEKLLVDAGTTSSFNLIKAKGSIDNYLQLNIQNTSAGNSASSDVVATADNGTESVNYIDMGINSSTYSNVSLPIVGGINNAYLYSTGNDFIIGNATAAKNLRFFTGGTANTNERMRIDGNGKIAIGNTTASELLTLGTAGTTAGIVSLAGATSGKAIITTAAAAGTPTITLPTFTSTLATLDGTETLSNKTFITPTLGVATATSMTITGTAGAGYVELQSQSGAPATGPSNSVRLFSNGGNLTWKKSDGFLRSFNSSFTADRSFTMPDASGTLAVSASGNIALSAVGNISFTGTLPIANGGTNSTATPTNGGIAYGNGSAYQFTAAGTTGQVLQSNGSAAPTWGPGINIVTLGSDVVNQLQNTIADVTGLSFSVTAGVTYHFQALINYTSNATSNGSRWAINGPASPTVLSYRSYYALTTTSETTNYATAYDQPATCNATSAATTGNICTIEGIIKPSANGTLIVRFASENNNQPITAVAGSTLMWW